MDPLGFLVVYDLDDGGNGDAEYATLSEAQRAFRKISKAPNCKGAELWTDPAEGEGEKLDTYQRAD